MNWMCHTQNTRQRGKFHQTGHKLNLRKFTVTIAGPLLWNALPTDLCVLRNIKIFRNRYENSLPLVAEWVKPLAAVHAGQSSLPVQVEA